MASAATEKIDFTLMYSTHDAFRRDVGRLEAAAEAGTAWSPTVRAGWENFKMQLLLHHVVEDETLWPLVQQKVAGRSDAHALLAQMEAEHAQLDPLLESVDARLRGGDSGLSGDVQRLQQVLDHHLRHEEDSALPLIQDVLTRADWRQFAAGMRRRQGVKGAAIYVPWAIDGVTPTKQEQFFAAMPAPVRVLNRLLWQPRYRRLALWHVAARG